MANYSYVNRTLCDVLSEMRKADETKNYSYLGSLIEEAQSMGNRMEAGLQDKGDVLSWTERRQELKKELRKLEQEIHNLKAQKKQLKGKS